MSTTKVLFLAANPAGTEFLQLDEEARQIRARIQAVEIREITARVHASTHRDAIELVPRMAVRRGDLIQELLEQRPQIVHFSGHGNKAGELVLTEEGGWPAPVSTAALVQLFRTLKHNVRLVVFNACSTSAQAKALSEVIDCVIGMNQPVGDESAIVFAGWFYGALGFGLSIQGAFDLGKAAIALEQLPSSQTPELHVRDGCDATALTFAAAPETSAAQSPTYGGQSARPSPQEHRWTLVPQLSGLTPAEVEEQVARPGLARSLLDRAWPWAHRKLTKVGTLSLPAEFEEIREYLGNLRANIEADFKHKVYLPLVARSVPTTALVDEAGAIGLAAPIPQVIRAIAGIAQGGDAASAQIAAVNRKSRVVRNVHRTLLQADEPLLLLGDPGTGKTMTLQQVVLSLAESEGGRIFPIVPVYVRLGEFHVDGNVGQADVLDYVWRSVDDKIRPYLDDLARAGRLVVLFDGMDEMSRDHYSEHTEALSRFAGARRGLVRTLFSCRITDFSPKFVHRRLVLLPFNRNQIKDYLERYIPKFPIEIDGKQWQARPLANHLARGGLPIEATNPFVLWLLCFRVLRTMTWPESRVDLLRFFIEETYRRKREELDDEPQHFPELEDAMAAWSRFGCTITTRNLGSAIPLCELIESEENAAEALRMIRVGELCGVLVETVNDGVPCIRFDHHRFQEYFTALHLWLAKPEINWLDKLDAPRWQETMVNLVLMGGADDGLRELFRSIYSLQAVFREQRAAAASRVEEEDGGSPTAALGGPAARSLMDSSEQAAGTDVEPVLSDRVELASRIARHCAEAQPSLRTELGTALRDAISSLARHGNPISQVKMIRTCQNLTDIDLIGTLEVPLASPINWVRNEALILIAEGRSGARAAGSDLATEIGYDLADGRFPARIPTYFKAALGSRQAATWCALVIGVVCQGLLTSILFGTVVLIALRSRAHVPGLDGSLGLLLAMGGALVVYLAAIKTVPRRADLLAVWLCGLVVIGYLAVIQIISKIAFTNVLVTISYSLISGIYAFFIALMLSLLCRIFVTSLYLISSLPCRRASRTTWSFYWLVWTELTHAEEAEDRNILSSVVNYILSIESIIIFGLLNIGLVLSLWVYLSRASIWYFDNPISATFWLSFLLLMLIQFGLVLVSKITLASPSSRFRSALNAATQVSLFASLGNSLGIMFAWFTEVLDKQIRSINIKLAFAVVVLFLPCYMLARLLQGFLSLSYARILLSRLPYPPHSFKRGDWVERMKNLSPTQQGVDLQRTNHQSLGLDAATFLEVLIQIQPFITREPALSTYWRQRDELLQVIRQEKQG